MAVYNGAPTLRATLDSILTADGITLEVIVVDDGSTDATGEILSTYAASDERVRVVQNATNLGLTRSLIDACERVRAPLIARHDVGDLSAPSRFAAEKALLDSDPETVLVSCWTQSVGPDLEPMVLTRGNGAAEVAPIRLIDLSRSSGVVDGPTHHGAAMFRTETYRAVGGYRPEFYYGQDWDLWFRIAERGLFRMVPAALYIARVTPSSISTTARERQQVFAKLAREALVARQTHTSEAPILARAAQVGPQTFRSTRDLASGLYFIGEALRRNRDARARSYLARAVRTRPTFLRAWVRWAQALALRAGSDSTS